MMKCNTLVCGGCYCRIAPQTINGPGGASVDLNWQAQAQQPPSALSNRDMLGIEAANDHAKATAEIVGADAF